MLSTPKFDRPIRPIFIVGAPRSGTSITTWAIGQLPNVQTMPETSWIATMATSAWTSFGYGSSRGPHSHLSNVAFDASVFMRRVGESVDAIVQDAYEERCRRLYGDWRATGELRVQPSFSDDPFRVRRSVDEPKQRWIDGTPYNSYFIWALVQMFPDAQFIHNLRRPEDVATSLEGFDKFGHDSVALSEGLRNWYSHTEFALLAERALGKSRVFRLDFNRLSGDREALFQDVAAFLGEAYTPDMLAPLAKRINSSEVDDRRAANAKHCANAEGWKQSEALYAQALAHPPSDTCDASALERLRKHFIAHAASHPLL